MNDINKEDYVLLMDNITKIYSNGFVANKDVTLAVKKGEIHALMGENGAGKTTLMKVLFGIETPEEGKIYLSGKEVSIQNPQHAISMGIGMVHQHFMLVESLSVAENLILGVEPKTNGLLDFKKAVQQSQEICEKYNFKIDPTAKIKDLPVGQKQKVEILKALLRGAKILILDEPTAVLTPQETDELFVQLKLLRENGHTIIFISHKLNEIKAICDRITVLRQGKYIGSEDVSKLSEEDISRMMVGRDIVLKFDKEKADPDKLVLDVRHLTKIIDGKKALDNVTFQLKSGVILGVAGVEGNGQKELSEIITGMDDFLEGHVVINGTTIKDKTIREIREIGVAHISEDRMTYGCAQNSSVWENIISTRFYKEEYGQKGILDLKKIKDLSAKLRERFSIKCDDVNQPVKMLSGGNIQKVVVAREFSDASNLIIANQPTRGIDIGATEMIRKELIRLSREGRAVLLISADLNEVLELSDSLIVMYDGKIAAYFEDASTVDEYELGKYMLGIKKQEVNVNEQ